MDDRAVVAAMASGDPRGLEVAYRRYADAIFGYCRSLLHDSDAAVDAVHDTFLAAYRNAAQLRDPDRLRVWLYAIARNTCLRQMRGRARQVPLEAAADLAAPVADPELGVYADEVRALFWEAVTGLSDSDRQVLELTVRHGLAVSDVGVVLGVSADHVHARLSRAKAQLERAIGALLVARAGAAHCPELAGILHGWDGTLTALLRKRISRHVESCRVCAERRRAQITGLLTGYAALPFLAVPAWVWHRIEWHTGSAGPGTRSSAFGVRFDPVTGFPRPLERRGQRAAVVVASGIVLVLTFAVSCTALRSGRPDNVALNPGTTQSQTGPAHPPASSEAVTAPTGTSATTSPPAPGRSGPATTAPATLNIEATWRTTCTDRSASPRFTLTVAVISSTDLSTATLHWSPPVDASKPMTVEGDNARAVVEGLAGARVTWWVDATTADGGRDRTAPVTVPHPCP